MRHSPMRALFYIAMGMFTFSCSDYQLHKKIDRVPDIHATPGTHDYGYLNASGDRAEIEVSISNLGNETLEISDVFLSSGGENFTVGTLDEYDLLPEEETTLSVAYDPATYETNYDEIVIISNDPDERRFVIPLHGAGDAPVISVSPSDYDFGVVWLGCEDEKIINISNEGNVDLEISDINYYATLPVDMYPEDFDTIFGGYPISVAPGTSIKVNLNYVPLDIFDDEGYFVIKSNDPLNPSVTAKQTGAGEVQSVRTDRFEQDELMPVDVLFVIDNSGSMGDSQAHLALNFDIFMNAFVVSGIDFNMAFITTDSSEFVGDVITQATPDPIGEAIFQISSIGVRGHTIEKGIEMSYNSLQPTAPAGPGSEFLRDDAKLVVIYVTDEDDFSDLVEPIGAEMYFRSLKTESDMVVAHAVAGDVPYGCVGNGTAQPGFRYDELVGRLYGTYLSICSSDWGTPMETLARDSITEDAFNLTEKPIESTIEVQVDGVVSHDWVYDTATGTVVFSVPPEEGAEIEVTYGVWARWCY